MNTRGGKALDKRDGKFKRGERVSVLFFIE